GGAAPVPREPRGRGSRSRKQRFLTDFTADLGSRRNAEMADANQPKPGSLSRETSRPGAPMGNTHGNADGSRVVEDAKEVGTELIGAVREGATSFFEEQRNRAASEI